LLPDKNIASPSQENINNVLISNILLKNQKDVTGTDKPLPRRGRSAVFPVLKHENTHSQRILYNNYSNIHICNINKR
jgi:hypothetical protein